MASVPQSRPGAFSGGGAGTSSPCVTDPSRKATCPSDPGCKPAVSVRFGSQRNRAEAGAAERVSGQETSTGPVSVIASQLVRLWGRPARRPGSARRPNAAHCPPRVPPALRPGLSSAQLSPTAKCPPERSTGSTPLRVSPGRRGHPRQAPPSAATRTPVGPRGPQPQAGRAEDQSRLPLNSGPAAGLRSPHAGSPPPPAGRASATQRPPEPPWG